MSNLGQSIKNGFQLVYWVFCKPISFKRKYEQLEPNSNISLNRFKIVFTAIATSLLPILLINLIIVGLVGLLSPTFQSELFDWGGALFGVAGGVAYGVAVGVAVGVAAVMTTIRLHLWLLEFLVVCFYYFRELLLAPPPRLTQLPFYFDEQIIIPLPFLERWLVQAYDKVPQQSLNTLDYLTNTTNQQPLVSKVKIRIVLEKFAHCRKLNDLLPLKDKFTWLPDPLPEEFDPAINDLLEISQDCRSAVQASTAYRSAQQLKPTLERLRNLQNSLAFNKSRYTSTLGQICQQWLSIITTAQQNYQNQSQASEEIPPAYIAGNALSPNDAKDGFKGRQDIFKQIETSSLSSSPPILLLYGGRRTGKTSSLKYLPRKVDSTLLPLLVDLQGCAITQQLSTFVREFCRLLRQSASDNFGLRIAPPNDEELEKDPLPALQNWLRDIENLKPHKRFLLCIDEYERLDDVIEETGSRAPLNFFRSFMQNNPRWILLFSGSHTIDELQSYWIDALIGTQSIRMTYLKREEAIDLIRKPVPDFPDIYSDETVDRILYWTNRQPYLIQLLATVLVEVLNQRPNPRKQRPTPEDIDDIVPKVLERGSTYFNEFWRRSMTAEQQQILTQLMLDGNLDGVPKSQIRRLIREKEVLRQTDGEHRFQVPLIETYCREQVG